MAILDLYIASVKYVKMMKKIVASWNNLPLGTVRSREIVPSLDKQILILVKGQ